MNLMQRAATISIITAVLTLLLKFAAYFVTNSVSLLSDALESFINLATGLLTFVILTIVSKPADDKHPYGHDKAEYFSSGVEGTAIVVAAVSIIYAAIQRFIDNATIEQLNIGIIISLIASLLNYIAARSVLKIAHKHDSIALEASAKHLLTDVWTSIGVCIGLIVIIFFPKWHILDPIMAILVALNIIFTGINLLKRSLDGLMDSSLPAEDILIIENKIIEQLNSMPQNTKFIELKTRKSGAKRFIEFKLIVPGNLLVNDAHVLCDKLEDAIKVQFPNSIITIHVEPFSS